MLDPLAQTAGVSPDIPKTGIESVDRALAAIVLTVMALSAALTVVRQFRAQIADLVEGARAMITGVEYSLNDLERGLAAELPSLPSDRVKEIAKSLHDRLTKRIQKTSDDAGTEPIVQKLVKETKSALRAVDEQGNPIQPKEEKSNG